MSLETFFYNFALLADAPNGVARLRQLILKLAVEGKLVSQNPKDESAGKAIKKGKSKRGEIVFQTAPAETPFALPHGWAWMKLADLGSWAIGSGFPTSEQGEPNKPILFCKVSDMNLRGNEKWIVKTRNSIDEETAKRIRAKAHPEDTVVFPKIGGAIATNKRRILTRPTAIDNNCLGIIPSEYCSSDWLYLLLSSIDFIQHQSETSVPALSQGVIGEIVTALPPLEEQKRIVIKVEELMRLCDELEARQQARRESRVRLNNSALAPLNKVASLAPEEFEQASVRLADNFAALYDSADTIGRLRSTILQLAIQGKLVPQNPNEESASVLFERIRKEKEQLIREKKIKTPQSFSTVRESEVPHDLAHGWKWVRLNDVFDVRDGTHDTPKYVSDGFPLVTSKNLYTGLLDLSNVKYISESDHRQIAQRSRADRNDILFAMIGSIGNPVIVDIDREFSIKNVALFKYFSVDLSEPNYLRYFLLTASAQMREQSAGGVQSFVSLTFLRKYLFPLPPLEEQKRIVAKVNQLMALCDELETKLRQAEADSEKLMNAAVQHVLASISEASTTNVAGA